MKKFLYLAAACLLAACNGGDEPEQQPSLEVKPLQLDFAAADAAPQEITVTAVGVEWEYILSGGASEWVTVDDSREGVLTVSVADNPAQERRTASLAVNPQGEYQGQTAQRDNSPGRERYACRLFADGGTRRTHLRA